MEEYNYRKVHNVESTDLLSHILIGDIDVQIKRAVGMYFGVLSNTQASLIWVMLNLLTYPDIMRKVQQEADSLSYPLKNEELSKTVILDAVIKETLRYGKAVPFHPRINGEPIEFQGYTIPKGSIIVVSPYVRMHGDAYPNPDKFDLNNIIGNENFRTTDFLTFGMGRHKCIGRPFAEMIIKTYIFSWLKLYTWKLDSKYPEANYLSTLGVPYPKSIISLSYKKK